jgi:hypothetical protein
MSFAGNWSTGGHLGEIPTSCVMEYGQQTIEYQATSQTYSIA